VTLHEVNSIVVILSDEDDTAELLMELQKIRKERMEEQEKKVLTTQCILLIFQLGLNKPQFSPCTHYILQHWHGLIC